MSVAEFAELLKLPPGERADLAIALWESLSNEQRNAELKLTPEQEAELDRRWAQHLAEPGAAIPWDDVKRKLHDGE